MSQTTYPTEIASAFAGMLDGIGEHKIKSILNNSGVVLPFGIAVKRSTSGGTKPDGIDVPTADTDKIAGILSFSHAQNGLGLSGSAVVGGSIPVAARADMLEEGDVCVIVEEAVAEGDQVYVRIANGVADPTKTQKGAFRKSADTATAFLVKGAFYKRAAGAGGLSVVSFNVNAAAV